MEPALIAIRYHVHTALSIRLLDSVEQDSSTRLGRSQVVLYTSGVHAKK